MAKQILIGIKEQELSEIAHYLVIYFPYNEEMCSYTDAWMGELYENKYPLVSKGMWSGIVDLKTHKLLNWKPEYGDLYLMRQRNVFPARQRQKGDMQDCRLCTKQPDPGFG